MAEYDKQVINNKYNGELSDRKFPSEIVIFVQDRERKNGLRVRRRNKSALHRRKGRTIFAASAGGGEINK
jgi:hypothetical protein